MNVSMYVYLNRKWNNMENPQNNNGCKYQQTYNTHSYKNAKISVNMLLAVDSATRFRFIIIRNIFLKLQWILKIFKARKCL